MKQLLYLSVALLLVACATSGTTYHVKNTRYQGIYKVGEPYQVDGQYYTPKIDLNYDETGIASWYGPNFHGKKTANGDIFDMNALTAAHKTIPLPSMVRVTNLENSRSLVVMVNDRGPFSNGRIIDLSKKSASLLGFKDQGLAKVRVQFLPGQTARLLENLGMNSQARKIAKHMKGKQNVAKANMQPEHSPMVKQKLAKKGYNEFKPQQAKQEVAAVKRIYIQTGAYSKKENADKMVSSLHKFGDVNIKTAQLEQNMLYRVRIGPVTNEENAAWLLKNVMNEGFTDAIIVAD